MMVRFSNFFAAALLSFTISGVTANDGCKDAVEVSTFPFQADGDLAAATPDFATPTDNFRNMTCGISTSSPGVWYRIRSSSEEGTFLKATVTDSPTTDTKFITALFKSSDSSCDNLDCVAPRAYTLENQRTEPTMTWHAGSNEVFYLHVAGTNENEVGKYTLNMEKLDISPVTNDKCTTAEPLEMETFVSADSTGAAPHGIENTPCSLHPDSRGTFYKIQGTGNKMVVTFMTDMPEEHRMEVAVVTGDDCGTCITMSDFLTAEDTPHSIQFESVEGESYMVVVSGERFSDAGEFQLEVLEQESGSAGDVFEMTPGDLPLMLDDSGSSCSFSHAASFLIGLFAVALVL